jgi:hypothetical protein
VENETKVSKKKGATMLTVFCHIHTSQFVYLSYLIPGYIDLINNWTVLSPLKHARQSDANS